MHNTMIKAESSFARSFDLFNPFTAPARKIFRAERCTDTHANSIVSVPLTRFAFNAVCVLMKILSHASAKKKTQKLKGFKFRTFMDHFRVIPSQ